MIPGQPAESPDSGCSIRALRIDFSRRETYFSRLETYFSRRETSIRSQGIGHRVTEIDPSPATEWACGRLPSPSASHGISHLKRHAALKRLPCPASISVGSSIPCAAPFGLYCTPLSTLASLPMPGPPAVQETHHIAGLLGQ